MEIKSKLTPHQQEVFEKITSKIKKNLSSTINITKSKNLNNQILYTPAVPNE